MLAFISTDGSTEYRVIEQTETRYYVEIRCEEFGWAVTNPRASFRRSHVERMLDTGKWRAL